MILTCSFSLQLLFIDTFVNNPVIFNIFLFHYVLEYNKLQQISTFFLDTDN